MAVTIANEVYTNILGQTMTMSTVEGNKANFCLPKGLKLSAILGTGAYGTVASAKLEMEVDESSLGGGLSLLHGMRGHTLAVKRIDDPFDHDVVAMRTLRELKFLRCCRHENVINVLNVYASGKTTDDVGDIYVISEIMETDLATVIKSSQELTADHIKFFLYQLLRGLKYMHSIGMIHRDLKPHNLLVSTDCDLKICDFGLARLEQIGVDPLRPMTDYVCTRWYRSPELLLAWAHYSTPVDMWSVGCVLAELLRRKALFRGRDTLDQLDIVFKVVGAPSKAEVELISNKKAKQYVKKYKNGPMDLKALCKGGDEQAIDLMESCLKFDPSKRPSCVQALEHPFLEVLHDPEDEPSGSPIDHEEFAFEKKKMDIKALKVEILRESTLYHPSAAARLHIQGVDLSKLEDVQADNEDLLDKALSGSKEGDEPQAEEPEPMKGPGLSFQVKNFLGKVAGIGK